MPSPFNYNLASQSQRCIAEMARRHGNDPAGAFASDEQVARTEQISPIARSRKSSDTEMPCSFSSSILLQPRQHSRRGQLLFVTYFRTRDPVRKTSKA